MWKLLIAQLTLLIASPATVANAQALHLEAQGVELAAAIAAPGRSERAPSASDGAQPAADRPTTARVGWTPAAPRAPLGDRAPKGEAPMELDFTFQRFTPLDAHPEADHGGLLGLKARVRF